LTTNENVKIKIKCYGRKTISSVSDKTGQKLAKLSPLSKLASAALPVVMMQVSSVDVYWRILDRYCNPKHRRRRRGAGGTCPPKIREKYFSGNYYVKFGHFSGKNHAKFGNFVNFLGKYKNSGILIIFRARIM